MRTRSPEERTLPSRMLATCSRAATSAISGFFPLKKNEEVRAATLRPETRAIPCHAGDVLVPTRQAAREYLVQSLEPHGYDSFFSWNFFDGILFRNEYFSPYIFEDTAEKLLKEDPDLAREFREKQSSDPAFAGNPYRQLQFIYERSPWSEPTFQRYPVIRLAP